MHRIFSKYYTQKFNAIKSGKEKTKSKNFLFDFGNIRGGFHLK